MAQCNHKCSYKRKVEWPKWEREDVCTESNIKEKRLYCGVDFEVEEGTTGQGMQCPLKTGNSKEPDSSLELPERTQCWRSILDF